MQQSFAPPLLSLSLSNLIYPFPLSLLPSLSYFHASLFSLSYCISLFYYIQPIAHILSFFFDLLMFLFLFCLLCLLSRARCKIQPPILTPRITIFSFREIHEIFSLALFWRSGSVSVKDTSSHALRKSYLFEFFTFIFMIKVKIIQ